VKRLFRVDCCSFFQGREFVENKKGGVTVKHEKIKITRSILSELVDLRVDFAFKLLFMAGER